MLNHNFLTCAKAEIKDLTVCIVVNGEKFQSHDVTLTLIRQRPMSNSSELFLCTRTCVHTHTRTQTHARTQTHTHTYRWKDRNTDRHVDRD